MSVIPKDQVIFRIAQNLKRQNFNKATLKLWQNLCLHFQGLFSTGISKKKIKNRNNLSGKYFV